MRRLAGMYHPITGTPFQQDETYMEVPPCDALKPYIRCFWGTKRPVRPKGTEPARGIVIPDTCMDVILDINYTKNNFYATFCGLDETTAITQSHRTMDETATFGIRFYAWTAFLFAENGMQNTRNARMDAEAFSKEIQKAFLPSMFEKGTMQEKIQIAERVLLKRLEKGRKQADFLNAVYRILESRGQERISGLCLYTGASARKLERDFEGMMGLPPKAFSSLVRYQLMWQEMAFSPSFNTLDMVEKYGYTDQAHLLHDFKKRHGLTPAEAVKFAREKR